MLVQFAICILQLSICNITLASPPIPGGGGAEPGTLPCKPRQATCPSRLPRLPPVGPRWPFSTRASQVRCSNSARTNSTARCDRIFSASFQVELPGNYRIGIRLGTVAFWQRKRDCPLSHGLGNLPHVLLARVPPSALARPALCRK